MTGWRCGWAVGPVALINACNALQSHSTSNVCSITQKRRGGGAARTAGAASPTCWTSTGAAAISSTRGCRWIRASRLQKPAGAFYMFPDVSEFLSPDGIRTSADLAAALLSDGARRA